MRYQNGLTLLEVMIVVLLIAVIAGVAWPAFQSTVDRNRAAQAANDLSAAIAMARNRAARDGEAWEVASLNGWENGWRVGGTEWQQRHLERVIPEAPDPLRIREDGWFDHEAEDFPLEFTLCVREGGAGTLVLVTRAGSRSVERIDNCGGAQ